MNYNAPTLLHPSKVTALLNETVVPAATSPEVPAETNYQMPLFELTEEEKADYDHKEKKGASSLKASTEKKGEDEKDLANFPLLLEFERFQELFKALIQTNEPNTFYLTRVMRMNRGIDSQNALSDQMKILLDIRKIRPRIYSRWTYKMLHISRGQLISSI